MLNTDNMSIVGVTVDYGPFGFMDRYDPGHICNASGKACQSLIVDGSAAGLQGVVHVVYVCDCVCVCL